MKIAVFGWYGHDNAGDERIKFCLKHFLISLGGIEAVDFFDLHEHGIRGKTNQFDHYNLVIIGGGGLILSQCNYHDFVNGINTKIVTLGVSVERPKLTGNSKKFAIALIEKSLAFLVRDKESAQKLRAYDSDNKIKISPDLTFLEPYKVVDLITNGKIGINLLPKPAHFKYSTLSAPPFSFLLRLLNYIGIKEFVKVIDFKNTLKELEAKFEISPIPLYCALQENVLPMYQKNDVEFLKLYFKKVSPVFLDGDIDKCCLFLSMRLHGSIFAVQKGVPVLSLSYLPKNRNFMNNVGLGNLVVESFETSEIIKSINYIQKNQSSIREKMISYRNAATLKIRQDLTEILNLVS